MNEQPDSRVNEVLAAAPELLRVLEEWFKTKTTQERVEWMHAARAAINKATS